MGHAVTLYEMADCLGGRARQIEAGDDPSEPVLDNGQHILIGAYTETLRLLAIIGVDAARAFVRLPLTLCYPDGEGLRLGPGRPAVAFARAVLDRGGWSYAQRWAMLAAAAGWGARRFRCPAHWTVDRLARRLPVAVRRDLIAPLCVAALNTPASQASASTFLRVVRDALFSGAGSSDLLLPRLRLGDLLPNPAHAWLIEAGAVVRCRKRVQVLERCAHGWTIDSRSFDAVVVATSAEEAARLTAPVDRDWARTPARLTYEPIVTVYLQARGTRLPSPMLLLRSNERDRPAQFVFDLGQLGGPAGLLAFVISGAAKWVEAGRDATQAAVFAQARAELRLPAAVDLRALRLVAVKRATFRCTPGLDRPAGRIAPGLYAAGDYVSGPYPATLEGAVRSGVAAAWAIDAAPRHPS